MKKVLLWIDDMRNPFEGDWVKTYSPVKVDYIVWVKNYFQFKDYIDTEGLPYVICFDHDLGVVDGEEYNGMDCAKYVVDYCIDHNCDIPLYNIQSSNPVGKNNIRSIMDSYHQFYINQ